MTSLSSFDITFLGTASAQPSSTRNHSSLALRLGGEVWLFDCGEATQHQVQRSKDVRMGRIRKIFITHTHGDHIFGLAPLMASAMNGAGGTVGDADDRVQTSEGAAPVEIYGPLGTRAYIRAALSFTHTLLEGRYVVHELRFPTDPLTDPAAALTPHACELVSQQRDILQAADGTWPDIFLSSLLGVSAAPIHHSVPCVGYVVSELPISGKIDPSLYAPHINRNKAALVQSGIAKPMSLLAKLQAGETLTLPDGAVLEPPPRRPGRKVVILGDTYDPRPIATLAQGADVLIHEATNAYLPGVDSDTKESDTAETVQARAVGHGHSTPQMAGAFAKDVGARVLVMNHFSARYPGDESEQSRRVMDAIRDLAVSTLESDDVVCARDFMFIAVPRRTST